MRFILLLIALAGTFPALAQRDYLTAGEVDLLRQTAQEPNERLKLYIDFANQRLGLLENALTSEKPGRSALVHDLLEQYNKIIDALDVAVDDALQRKADITLGIKAVSDAEKGFLPRLKKIEESRPKDFDRYEFALQQAVETTQDSLDMSLEDLGKRSAEVAEREQREKKELEGMMQPKDLEEKKAAEQKAANAEKNKRKAPTLLKKGETVKK